MAKKSWVERKKKREALVRKYAALRAELKAKGDYAGLAKIPRNASPVRRVNRCQVTGRKPVINKSRKSVANFKLRRGQAIGCRVTLRRDVMYEFFDRLTATALPRIRDFRGVSARAFDGRGSYSLGVADQSIFPEIDLDKIKRHQGMDITIVTTAPTDQEALDLLKLMGMPFAEGK